MARPTDAELVKLLNDAATEYEHGAEYNLSRVPRDEERMNNIAISRARQCRDAADALEAASVPTVTFEERHGAVRAGVLRILAEHGPNFTDGLSGVYFSELANDIAEVALRAAGLSEEGCR